MTPAEIVASIQAEKAALEHTASLIYEVWARLALIDGASAAETTIRVTAVHDVWVQLDELGVDLNLPDLKSLVAAHAANHATSSGAVNAHSTPAATPGQDVDADLLPAPLDPTPLDEWDDPFVREV